MNYSRQTLISDWHKYREAEPKDYDASVCPDGQRKLHKSTYKHFGTHLDADWKTTSQMAQSNKKMHEAKDSAKSMVQADYFHSLVFERDTDGKSAPPCYQPNSNESELITTYALDYVPLRITTKQAMQVKLPMDRKLDFRRRQSQFTDVADHRRWGRNTWQDFNDVQAKVQGTAKSLYRQIHVSCP